MFQKKSYIWEKSCSWDIGENALSQSGCRIFKSFISSEQIDETASFLACGYKRKKVKSWLKIFWSGMVKNEVDQSGLWTLKWWYRKNELMELTDFLHVDTDSQKLKADQKCIGWAWSKMGVTSLFSGHRTQKLTLSQKWTDEINWFFACWYKFKKAKSWFNDFWVGLVKKRQWPFSSWYPKICCILRMNLWNELIFLMLIVI